MGNTLTARRSMDLPFVLGTKRRGRLGETSPTAYS